MQYHTYALCMPIIQKEAHDAELHAEDIFALQQHLADLKTDALGIILKIETRHAFAELPKLLLASMRAGRFGVSFWRACLPLCATPQSNTAAGAVQVGRAND